MIIAAHRLAAVSIQVRPEFVSVVDARAFLPTKRGPSFEMRSSAEKSPPTGVLAKNPRRVEAGRSNRKKRRGLTPQGRETLRRNAIHYRPWQFATGPKTATGKAISARNRRRKGTRHPQLQAVWELRKMMLDRAAALRQVAAQAIAAAAAQQMAAKCLPNAARTS